EQTDLTALGERADQVNNLDAGFEQLNRGRQFVELGSFLVNGAGFGTVDGTTFVDGATQDVHDAAQRGHADGHRDGSAGVGHGHATTQTVGGTHGDGANHAVAQLLLDFESQALLGECGAVIGELESVINVGNAVAGELNIHHGADALNDGTVAHV